MSWHSVFGPWAKLTKTQDVSLLFTYHDAQISSDGRLGKAEKIQDVSLVFRRCDA
jgi:hypothetical protein